MANGVRLIRGLLKEIRIVQTRLVGGLLPLSWKQSPVYSELIRTSKSLQHESDKEVVEKHMFEGELFLNYIQSLRKEEELQDMYKGAGETPLEDIAARVGLRLPKIYKDERNDL